MSDTLLMLLEMIEEVLEEQSDSLHNFVRKVLEANGVKTAEEIKDKNSKGMELNNRITYRIESADRQRLALEIGDKLGKAAIPIYSSDGSTIIGHKTKDGTGINFKYVLKPTGRYGNEAEKMELVIARASGNTGVEPPEGFGDRVPNYEAAAKQMPGAPLAKLETQKLPAKGLYASYGVLSGTPKTDLIGTKDKNEKYSVKKAGGSQFASAQGAESAALWHIALINSVGQKQIGAAVQKALNEVPAMIKDNFASENFGDIKAASRKDKAEVFKQFKEQLFGKIVENLSINKDAFKKAFTIEGYSGAVKFGGGDGTANKILIWSNNAPFIAGNPRKPIDVVGYVNSYKDRISIRVSDRGGKRGGAIRGEILNRPVQNESINEEALKNFGKAAAAAALGAALTTGDPIPGTTGIGQPSVSADQSDQVDSAAEETEINGEVVKDRLEQIYGRLQIVRFLDALKTDEEGGEINMRPLYEAALKDDVEFVDFAPPDEKTPMEGT
jgi:hypothetical protein